MGKYDENQKIYEILEQQGEMRSDLRELCQKVALLIRDVSKLKRYFNFGAAILTIVFVLVQSVGFSNIVKVLDVINAALASESSVSTVKPPKSISSM